MSTKAKSRITRSSRIVGLCILAAACYGVAHDQITARVCVEYLAIGHPIIFPTNSPTRLGLIWVAVAWAHAASCAVGAPGGIILCVRAWRRRGAASVSGAST